MLRSLFNKEESLDPEVLRKFHIFASIFILAIIAGIFFYFFWPRSQPRKDFYNELWAPTYLMVHGKSPYNTTSLNTLLPAAWFPMAIGFFGPLGWLGEETALLVWFLISTLELCVIIFLSQGKSWRFQNTVLAPLLAFLFPPTLYHIILGQITLTVVLCMVLAGYLTVKKHPWSAAFCVALGLSKPHIGILAVLGLSLCSFKIGGTRAALSFYLRVFLWILALCLPLFLAYPNWIPDAIASMRANPSWLYPSLFIVLRRSLGGLGLFLWALVVCAVLAFTYYLWKKFPPITALYWSLGLSLLITPYIGSWDFVALLPVLIATFSQVDWKRKALLILAYLLAWQGMALVQGLEVSLNHYFWWVPPWLLAIVAAITPWREQLGEPVRFS